MTTPAKNYFRYIPIRPRDVQWGLYVTGAGRTFIPPGVKYPPQNHPELYDFRWETGRTLPEYQAIYITRGCGVFDSAQTGQVNVQAGAMILLFPGVWHRYRPSPATGWDEYWVSFNGKIADNLVKQKFFGPERAVLHTGLQNSILAPYESLVDRLNDESAGFPHLIAADVFEILAAASAAAAEREPAELIAQGPQEIVAVKDRIVAEAMRLIWRQNQNAMTIDGLARQLAVTRRSLERRFNAAVGHGIHDEILRCRLERAKRLLAATDLSLKEIASAAGFSTADALGRTFRRVENVTPLEYRRKFS